MEQTVHERALPLLADDRRAKHAVAQRPRFALGQRIAPVDRERQDVGCLVDAEVLPLEDANLARLDKRNAELAVRDALAGEDLTGERDGGGGVDRDAAAVR